MDSFEILKMRTGHIITIDGVEVHGIDRRVGLAPAEGTRFVYVHRGLVWVNSRYILGAGQYACVTDGPILAETDTVALIIQVRNYRGMFMVGGPIERAGRLRYIDGCTDSLLIPPVKKGDPCLNYLHFPDGVIQTPHTHPSVRIGMVAHGTGKCITPQGVHLMNEGDVFIIHKATGETVPGSDWPVGSHGFVTDEDEMRVIAFHPDSEVGPTDEVHQMKAATKLIAA